MGRGGHDASRDPSVERLSVAEAAEALGLTRDAIHKRIRRGSIRYEKGEDGRFYVFVDTSTVGLDQSVYQAKDESKVEVLERLVDSQGDQIEFLRAQLEAERQAHAEARRIIGGLVQRIPELEAPRESPTSPAEASEGTEPRSGTEGQHAATERPEEERRSWWGRIFGY